jgi:hypothetical protein
MDRRADIIRVSLIEITPTTGHDAENLRCPADYHARLEAKYQYAPPAPGWLSSESCS